MSFINNHLYYNYINIFNIHKHLQRALQFIHKISQWIVVITQQKVWLHNRGDESLVSLSWWQLSFISLKNYLLFYLLNLKVPLKRTCIQSHLVSSI